MNNSKKIGQLLGFLLFSGFLGIIPVLQGCEEEVLPGTISGIVSNSQFGEPIDQAIVTISGTNEQTETGSGGRFEFSVNPGTYTVQYSHPEFETDRNTNIEVGEGISRTADIALSPTIPIDLSLISVDFGLSSEEESFNITNLRNGELNFSITASADFIKVFPNSGQIGSQNSSLIRVEIDRETLEPGEITEQLVVNIPNRGSRTLDIVGTQPEPELPLSFSVEQLDFSTSISTLEINVSNTSNAFVNFDIQSSNDWLTPERTLGSLAGLNSDILSISVDRSRLSVGDDEGTLIFNVPSIGSKIIPVLISKLDASSAVLVLSAGVLGFGSSLEERTIEIINEGSNTLSWDVNVSDSWISLSEISGSLPSNNRQEITVFVDRNGLQDGDYIGQLAFTSNGGSAEVIIDIEVDTSIGGDNGDIVVISGLRAYYTFDQGLATDKLGNFNGISFGVLTTNDTPDGSQYAGVFDGVDDFFQIDGNPIQNSNANTIHASLSCWVKTSSGGILISIPVSNNDDRNAFICGITNEIAHSFNATFNSLSTFNLGITSLLFDEQWHHLVVSYNGSSGVATLFIDGIKLGQDSQDIRNTLNASSMRISQSFAEINGISSFFNGHLDNLRIYNRPLTSSEVKEIFDNRQ